MENEDNSTSGQAVRDQDSDSCQTTALETCVESLGLTSISRHLFLCADQTRAVCCDQVTGGLELSEVALERVEVGSRYLRAIRDYFPYEGKLLTSLSKRTHSSCLSRRRLVSLRHPPCY
jgi:hypothetical protein